MPSRFSRASLEKVWSCRICLKAKRGKRFSKLGVACDACYQQIRRGAICDTCRGPMSHGRCVMSEAHEVLPGETCSDLVGEALAEWLDGIDHKPNQIEYESTCEWRGCRRDFTRSRNDQKFCSRECATISENYRRARVREEPCRICARDKARNRRDPCRVICFNCYKAWNQKEFCLECLAPLIDGVCQWEVGHGAGSHDPEAVYAILKDYHYAARAAKGLR